MRELQKQVRRLTAFGTVALLGVGATALLIVVAGIAGVRTLARSDDRIRFERAALTRAAERDAAARRYLFSGLFADSERASEAGASLQSALDSLTELTSHTGGQRQRLTTLRGAFVAWDSTVDRSAFRARPATETPAPGAALALVSAFDRLRQVSDSIATEDQRSYRSLQRNLVAVGVLAGLFVLGVIVVIWVLRRLGKGLLVQRELVLEKQSLLEQQATELREHAQSLEQVNTELERALRTGAESEARLSAALASAPVGFVFLDRDLRYRRVNEWVATLNQASPDQHMGRRVDEVNEPVARAFLPYYQRVRETRQPLSNVEISIAKADSGGRPRHCLANFYPIVVGPEELMGVGAVISDISDRKLLEEQFRQSQKMEAVGRLAGGVAHDFNNLLTAISGFSEFALGAISRDHPAREDIEQALQACQRGGALTRQLLTFSRQHVVQTSVMSLNDVVRQMEPLLRRLIGEHVTVAVDLDPTIGLLKADKGQVEQVLMNVVINARDAMPFGGQLRVETANIDLHDGFVQQGDFRASAGPHVMLCVTDSGVGMDADTRAKIFEPFFTTKSPGKGTGLGLATVYGIVKQSSGSIWVYSEPGIGTSFKIYFPRFEGTADEALPGAVPASVTNGSGYVLVVDDDEHIRKLAVRSLRKAGFETLEANNGTHGLELAHSHASTLRAIIADVVMPGMGGREMMRQLRSLGIAVPALYMSGWTADAIEMESFLSANDGFLEKPFSPESLTRAIHELVA